MHHDADAIRPIRAKRAVTIDHDADAIRIVRSKPTETIVASGRTQTSRTTLEPTIASRRDLSSCTEPGRSAPLAASASSRNSRAAVSGSTGAAAPCAGIAARTLPSRSTTRTIPSSLDTTTAEPSGSQA